MLRSLNFVAVSCEPEYALGMESGKILDYQITASTYHRWSSFGLISDYYTPWEARLNNESYWRPRDDTLNMLNTQWIQVDFLKPVIITGIQTQGGTICDDCTRRWLEELEVNVGNSTNEMIYASDSQGNQVRGTDHVFCEFYLLS